MTFIVGSHHHLVTLSCSSVYRRRRRRRRKFGWDFPGVLLISLSLVAYSTLDQCVSLPLIDAWHTVLRTNVSPFS